MADLKYTAAEFPKHITHSTLCLPQADIAVFTSTPPNPPADPSNPLILLAHGNSCSSLIWKPIFNSPLSQTHTIIAFDLPGHGASSDAKEDFGAEKVYTQQEYAAIAKTVLEQSNKSSAHTPSGAAKEVVFVGWSLGGHVGIELCESLRNNPDPSIRVTALLLVGTPPVPPDGIDSGFYLAPQGRSYAGMEHLTREQVDVYGRNIAAFGPHEAWMREAVARTDGRARRIMFATFRDGSGACDQRAAVERLTREGHGGDGTAAAALGRKPTVVAVVNGAREPFVNIRWVREGVDWGVGLWRGRCFELEGAVPSGHTPFWEDWESFWPLFRDLVAEVSP